jgi:glycosyltransferase involved in cell wall biosynthesis
MVTTFFGPESFGGDAAYVDRLSRALLRRGHEVAVVHCADSFDLVRRDLPPRAYEPPEGMEIHTLRSPWGALSPLWTHQTGRPGPKAPELRELLEGGRFDVVHFHNISLVGGPGVIEMAPAAAVKLMTLHEHWLVCPTSVLWKFGRGPCTKPSCTACTIHAGRPPQLWRRGGRIERALESLDHILAPSNHTAEGHRARGIGVPIRVLPYHVPADWHGLPEPPEPATWDRPYVAAAGRLVPEKGFGPLIEAMRSVPEVDLVIGGGGPAEPELHRAARDLPNVRFAGLLDPPDLGRLLAGARAVVVPSLFFETFGYVVAEAAAVGTPAIVHDRGATPELIAAGGGGIVYRTEPELVDAIRRLATDDALHAELGERASEAARTLWSEDRHMDGYLGLLGVDVHREGHAGVPAG